MKYKEYTANVIRVIDGDTIEVMIDMGFGIKYTSKLRFLDFDAPETYRPSCQEEKEAGRHAKMYLYDRLSKLESVTLRTYKDTQKKNKDLLKKFKKSQGNVTD